MDSEGGSYYQQNQPCPNCNKRSGYMGSSDWAHDYMCCSKQCGVRLGHRIRHGFKPGLQLKCGHPPHWPEFNEVTGTAGYVRRYSFPPDPHPLRIRVKILHHRLRQLARAGAP